MIEIRAWFGEWKEVDRSTAFRFVYHMMEGITTTSVPSKKAALIDGKHLRGITVQELLGV